MTYETRVVGDAFAGLSTAESDAFLTEYNAARNDRERAAVIRRHLTARGSMRSQRPAKSDPNAARQRALTSKMLDPIDLDIQAKRRELMKREHDPFWWD